MSATRYALVLFHNDTEEKQALARYLLQILRDRQQEEDEEKEEGTGGGGSSVMVSLCPLNEEMEVTNSDMAGQWTELDSMDVDTVSLEAEEPQTDDLITEDAKTKDKFQTDDPETEELQTEDKRRKDPKRKRKDPKTDDSDAEDPHTEEKEPKSPKKMILAEDLLHDMADNLPYTGFILDIYLVDLEMSYSKCMSMFGALMRLQEWHSAAVKVLGGWWRRHAPMTVLLSELAQASFFLLDNLHNAVSNLFPTAWRGDLLWPGKKGFTQQGLSLLCEDHDRLRDKLSVLHFWRRTPISKAGGDTGLLLGRDLEVLSYVNIDTVPLYLFDDFHLQLQMTHPAESRFGQMMDTLSCNEGVLCRVSVYESALVPLAAVQGVSFESWKLNLAASELPNPEPAERASLPCRQHLFLLIRGGQTVSRPLLVSVLRSPSQVDAGVYEAIHQQAYFGSTVHWQGQTDPAVDKEVCAALDRLPMITAEDFNIADEACTQSMVQCANALHGTEKSGSVTVTPGQLVKCAQATHEALVEMGKPQKPQKPQTDDGHTSEDGRSAFTCHIEGEQLRHEWPERRALLESEAKAKVLRRYGSNESYNLMLSSPLAPEDCDTSIDAKDMVKWFKPDGNAILDDLSPVKPAVRPPRLSNANEALMEWPACQHLQFHDVYYENTKRSERQEKFYQKFRDDILLEESLHVCDDKPHRIPALRYKNSTRVRTKHMDMDVSCGGNKLTPINRPSLSPKSMLQATPSAKHSLKSRIEKESRGFNSKGSASKSRRESSESSVSRRDSSESGVARRHRRSLEKLCDDDDDDDDDKREQSFDSLSERLSQKEKRSLQSSFDAFSSRDRRSLDSSYGDRRSPQSPDENQPGPSGSSSRRNSLSGGDAVFYPRNADPELPPFRRKVKEGVTIFTPASSYQGVTDSDGHQRSGSGSKKKRSSPSQSISEDDRAERRLSSESTERRLSSDSVNRRLSDESDRAGMTDQERRANRRERNERHKRRLQKVVIDVLHEAGVTSEDPLFQSCYKKLYKVSLFYVKELPDAKNLRADMKSIAEKQVQQVVDLEMRRQDLQKLRQSKVVG